MKKLINILNKFLFKIRKQRPSYTLVKKILVVSNTALGDTILSTPVIKTMRKSFPNIHIVFMVNKNVYPLFKDYKYVNDVIVYKKKLFGLIGHIFYIKRNKFDSIFFLHSNGPQDLFISLLSNVTNIHKAINYPSKVSPEFLSLIRNKTQSEKNQHIIEHRLDTIRYLNPSIIDKTISLPLKFSLQAKKNTEELLIGIQLGAADIYKMWPIQNFINLTNILLEKNKKIKILLLGIQKERILANKLKKASIQEDRVLNYCGKTSIEELTSLVNSLDLLVTNDTGTLHLAVALEKNSVSLFSPTNSKIFGPYQDNHLHSVIQKDGDFINTKPKKERNQEAMNLITVNEVYDQIIPQINRIIKCAE